jgi:hypothetical protein
MFGCERERGAVMKDVFVAADVLCDEPGILGDYLAGVGLVVGNGRNK